MAHPRSGEVRATGGDGARAGPGRLEPEWPKAGVMVLAVGPDEFLVIGSGVIVTFEPEGLTSDRAGILFIDHLRIPARAFGIQTIRLYRYR
jgi:hypothetical protein